MNFHLRFPIAPISKKINYSDKLIFLGSCFSENIGDIMFRYKFNVIINPNGILYNPSSVATAIKSYLKNEPLKETDLFYANDCWNSWQHHSRFSHPEKQFCLDEINSGISNAHDYLKEAEWLFITFGSAYIYTLNSTGKIVGNCHKFSQKEFTKSMLSVSEIVDEYANLSGILKKINPRLKIVYTVSPVRYIRDGLVENNLSKSVLIQAVHQLVQKEENTFYFPAYELVIDDLRDYRFYKSDLIHPNEQAIDYVFEKLSEVLFSEETKILFEKIKEVIVASEHRPFNENSEGHKKFKTKYAERCKKIMDDHSFLDLRKELQLFSN